MSDGLERRLAVAFVQLEMERLGVPSNSPMWQQVEEHADLAVQQYGDFAKRAVAVVRAYDAESR